MKSVSGISPVPAINNGQEALSAHEHAPRQRPAPQREDAPVPHYTGEERRKFQRRVRQTAILIELRSGQERRRADSTAGHIDEEA